MAKSNQLDAFLDGEFAKYDGYRSVDLPWAASMCLPLCFDPDEAAEQFEWGGVSERERRNIYPIAQFYEANSTSVIDDIWAFIVVKVLEDGTEEVMLWTDEGPSTLGKTLSEFLDGLLSPDHPNWKMDD